MKKQMRLVIYLVLIVLFSFFLLWKEGWYIDGEKCYKEYLRDITNTDKSGGNAYGLIIGAKKIGFNAFGVKGEITVLSRFF